LVGHKGAIFSLALSEDEKWLFSASGDGTVRAWDPVALVCRYVIQAQPEVGDILALAYSNATGFLYLGCQNTSIQAS
jgi:di- and tripeptidase